MFGWLKKKKQARTVAVMPPAVQDDGFATSLAIGYATNDGIVGGLLGGNLLGGIVGDALNTSDSDTHSHHSTQEPSPPTDRGSHDHGHHGGYDAGGSYDSGSSCDSGSSYDSSSSFDSGSSCDGGW